MSYDSDVVAATNGRGGEADWGKIIKLCDRIRDSIGSSSMSSALTSIMKRVKNPDSQIQLQALTLLEACVSNCGKNFQLELTKPSFQSQAKEILTSRSMDQATSHRLKTLLATWASEYRSDPQMSGFNRFVEQLVKDNIILLQGGSQSFASPSMYNSTPPSQVSQEDDDLQKAIRLSLEEAKSSQPTSSMYPTFDAPINQTSTSSSKLKVRAVYDFEAAEDNEISFKAGEIITVLDNSDENWWKGETQLGIGLFPANFVSKDLNAPPEPLYGGDQKSTNATTNPVGGADGGVPKKVEVNEGQVDLLLEMLKTADITCDKKEELKTLNDLEEECKVMKPLAEKNIENLQKQLDMMNEVSQKLQESFAVYRKLLQEAPRLSQKAPPPAESTPHPPPYQSNNNYFAPPPPNITGTYNYVAPPTQMMPSLQYLPQENQIHGGVATSYAPPPQSGPPTYVPPSLSYVPPTQGGSVAPPTMGGSVSYVQPTHGAPPTMGGTISYAPPTQGGPSTSYVPLTHGGSAAPPTMGGTSYAPPTQTNPVTIDIASRNGGTSPQLMHPQLTPPTNSYWATPSNPTMYQQTLHQPLL